MKAFHVIAFILVAVGAINWGLVGATDWNLVEAVLGTGSITKVVYILVGLSGLSLLFGHKRNCRACSSSAGTM